MSAGKSERVLVSVVIVNFRTPKLVSDCLETLMPELSGIDAKVVVVDNHSADGSEGVISDWIDLHEKEGRVLLVQTNQNGGFAYGNNVGISACNAQYYLLLNSDTLIRPGAMRMLLDTVIHHPHSGLFSPRLEWPDGTGQESCFRFPSLFSEMSDASNTGLIDIILAKNIVAMPVQTQIARPEWTSFACVLIKDEVIKQIGLLDEGYFMYFEDVEFCHRARRAGWAIVHNPQARVVHLRGGSSAVKEQTRTKKRVSKYFYESRARYFYQAHGWFGLTAANVMWWLGRLVSGTRQLLGRSDKAAVERQWIDIWTNWLNPLKPKTVPKS